MCIELHFLSVCNLTFVSSFFMADTCFCIMFPLWNFWKKGLNSIDLFYCDVYKTRIRLMEIHCYRYTIHLIRS